MRVALRHIAIVLLGKLPGTRFKSRLFSRLFGIKMGRDVGLAYGVFLDPYDPSMISFGDNVIVGMDTKIFVHVFTLTRQRVRAVKIGSNVMIGGFCVIAPGVTIGDGASIAPGTFVTRSVPAGAMVLGNSMEIRKRGMQGEAAGAADSEE
jgi:acetyltransferase-like isoleucine patch superfamily enzyme